MNKTRLFIILMTTIMLTPAKGQHKIPMDHSIYNEWKRAENAIITDDGAFVGFEVKREKGDGFYCVYNIAQGSTDTIFRGAGIKVLPGSKFIAGNIVPPGWMIRQAKKENRDKADYPRDSLFVYNLNTGETVKFPDVRSFSVPREGSDWIALYHGFAKEEKPETDTLPETCQEKMFRKLKSKFRLASVVLYNPDNRKSFTYENVYDYALSENGNLFAFQQLAPDSVPVTVTYAMVIPDESLNIVHENHGMAWNLATDKQGHKLAFMTSIDSSVVAGVKLFYWEIGDREANSLVDSAASWMFPGWGVNRNGKLWFSDDESRLFFGTSPVPAKEPEDTLLDEEKPHLDVWSWQDHYLQPQQKKQLEHSKKLNYQAMYDLVQRKFIQLADTVVENLVTMHGGDGPWMLGFETGPYERQSSWTGISSRDVWLINTDSGQKTQVAKNLSNTVVLSPFGKFIVYYVPADSSWHSYNIVTAKTINLISGIRAGFYDEENDVPKLPDSYGIAGFSKDDEYVLLYDRYDIWCVDPSGSKIPFCLTSQYGRQNNLRLRYVKLDKDEYFISLKQPLYLSTFNERTMQTWLCLSLSRRSYHPKGVVGIDGCLFGSGESQKQPDVHLQER